MKRPNETRVKTQAKAGRKKHLKIYPEIALEAEWTRQAQYLAKHFAKELKFVTTEKYMATLPKFESQPKDWIGKFETPVIVETRVSPKRQSELIGIRYYLDGLKKTDWNENLDSHIVPGEPYAAWLDDGRNKLNQKPEDVAKNLRANESAGTELDGIALYMSNPEILEHHFLYLPGTKIESEYVAFMDLWFGVPRLDFNFIDSALPKFGAVVRGRQK